MRAPPLRIEIVHEPIEQLAVAVADEFDAFERFLEPVHATFQSRVFPGGLFVQRRGQLAAEQQGHECLIQESARVRVVDRRNLTAAVHPYQRQVVR